MCVRRRAQEKTAIARWQSVVRKLRRIRRLQRLGLPRASLANTERSSSPSASGGGPCLGQVPMSSQDEATTRFHTAMQAIPQPCGLCSAQLASRAARAMVVVPTPGFRGRVPSTSAVPDRPPSCLAHECRCQPFTHCRHIPALGAATQSAAQRALAGRPAGAYAPASQSAGQHSLVVRQAGPYSS